MICSGYNSHIMELLGRQELLWKCVLSDGTNALSDFDLPDAKDPWTRLKIYCNNNNLDIVEVRVISPGMPETLIYQDPNGLDNIFMIRGMCKDITDDGGQVFKFMCFGKLEDDGKIHVKKFYWPQFELGESEEIRGMTEDNDKLLYKKRKKCKENCECQSNEQI